MLFLAGLTPALSQAADGSWNVNSNGTWINSANWLDGIVPGSTTATPVNSDIATFSFPLTAASAVAVDTGRYIGGISFGNTSAFGYTLSGGSVNLNNGGVIQTLPTDGAHIETISSAITINGGSGSTATFTAGAANANANLVIGAVNGSATTASGLTTLTLNGTRIGAAGSMDTISGVIGNGGSGGGKLAIIKDGTGTWALSGANTFSGQLTVSAGTLQVATLNAASANGPLGNSLLAVILGGSSSPGTLQVTATTSQTSTKSFTMGAGGGVFQFDGSTVAHFLSGGSINGTGSLTKTGPGTLRLGDPGTYSGGTFIKQGWITLDTSVDRLPTSGVLTLGDTATTGGLVLGNAVGFGKSQTLGGLSSTGLGGSVITSGGSAAILTLNVATGRSYTFAGLLGSSSSVTVPGTANYTAPNGFSLVKSGNGTQILTGTSTYTGGTLVSAGTLIGSSTSLLGAITNNSAVIFDQAVTGSYGGLMSGTGH